MGAIGQYLERIAKWPLLTPAQEIDLGRLIQAGIETSQCLGERKPNSEELRAIKTGKRSLDRMVQCNLRLVISVAKLYAGPCRLLEIEDLIQYGSTGLQRAAEKFDPTRGYKFSTYARKWIMQEVKRGIYKSDLAIRLPEHCHQDWARVQKQNKKLTIKLNRTPTTGELIKSIGVNEKNFYNIARAMEPVASLNVQAEHGNQWIDNLPSPESENTVTGDYTFLFNCIEALPANDRVLVGKHFGLNGYDQHTLEQLGEQDGVTKEAIRQRLRRIQKRMKILLSEKPQ